MNCTFYKPKNSLMLYETEKPLDLNWYILRTKYKNKDTIWSMNTHWLYYYWALKQKGLNIINELLIHTEINRFNLLLLRSMLIILHQEMTLNTTKQKALCIKLKLIQHSRKHTPIKNKNKTTTKIWQDLVQTKIVADYFTLKEKKNKVIH